MNYPIFTGTHGNCHIQGIAVDQKKGYIYYSFTTKLIKSTLDGQIVGSVEGLTGHLGCIDFNEADGRVYGSLEYKNDVIGRGILKALGKQQEIVDAFYIVMFDVDKIDRMDMDAEKDGVMTAVHLQEVYNDFKGNGLNEAGEVVAHKYGCSGIDGTTIGPMPGADDGKQYLFVTYGVYRDENRADNDYQVMLCYDTSDWAQYEQPLSQEAMHRNGPVAPTRKFFVLTGNTTYGVQNLEYDAYTNRYLMAVYRGFKPEYPNYDLYAVDASVAPKLQKLKGLNETGEVLTLAKAGKLHETSGVYGWNFPYGSTGLWAKGDGTYLISENHVGKNGQCSYIYEYVYDEARGFVINE